MCASLPWNQYSVFPGFTVGLGLSCNPKFDTKTPDLCHPSRGMFCNPRFDSITPDMCNLSRGMFCIPRF